MKVLIDGIHLSSNMKGVGRYLANALQHLSSLDPTLDFSVLVFQGTPTHLLSGNGNIHYIHVPRHYHLGHVFGTLPKWVRRIHPDVLWIPYETPFRATRLPYVMVCHDVPQKIREAQKGECRLLGSLKEHLRNCIDDLLMGKTLRGAEIVFSNSQYVASWLKKDIRVPAARIRYAPCAPGADFHRLSQKVNVEDVRRRLHAPRGYILVFHTGDRRENFSVVPEVYQAILNSGLPQDLVVGGVQRHLLPAVRASLWRFPWRDRVHFVPFLRLGEERELAEIYTAASVYLDPSLHEGFGMQVIEAMACQIPVVCSNRGALPEVARDGALLVNPQNMNEMAGAVIQVLSQNNVRDHLIRHGYENSQAYSWPTTARIIHQGLLDLAGMG
jgi:glycosyltransferase involved in cell wall biosynthesis